MRIATQRAKAVMNMKAAVDLIADGDDVAAARHIKRAHDDILKITEPAKKPDKK